MAKKQDSGSWGWGLFIMLVGFVLWGGLSGFWWGVAAAIVFLSGFFYLPPLVRWTQKNDTSQ